MLAHESFGWAIFGEDDFVVLQFDMVIGNPFHLFGLKDGDAIDKAGGMNEHAIDANGMAG